MISATGASGDGAAASVQVGGYVLGTCRVIEGGADDPAARTRCTRAMEVSVSRETAEAETQIVRVRVTPR